MGSGGTHDDKDSDPKRNKEVKRFCVGIEGLSKVVVRVKTNSFDFHHRVRTLDSGDRFCRRHMFLMSVGVTTVETSSWTIRLVTLKEVHELFLESRHSLDFPYTSVPKTEVI